MEKEKTRILIVDDEPQNTAIIQEILHYQDDYVFETAVNGEEALLLVDRFRPEIILLDIMMPGMDGYDVCRRIRNAESHRFVKIIMVSGMSMIEERLKGYEAGADDYITKPFVEDELLAKIGVFSKLSRIEEVDLLKTTALHLMTHETRTPLNGILLGCDFLKNCEGLPVEAVEYVDIIYSSGQRMHSLVSKIDKLCNLQGGVNLSITEKELDTELEILCERFESEYPETPIVLRKEGSFLLKADWVLMQSAIWYVVENAGKYGEKEEGVTIVVQQPGDDLVLKIEDSGPGLNQETIDRVFDGLFTENIMHHHQGSGLSLSITSLVMRHHRGTISCSNRDGGGACFSLTFPPDSFSRL